MSKEAHKHLVDLGINVHTGTRVKTVNKNEIICLNPQTGQDMSISTGLTAWCAGIKAEPWLKDIGLETTRLNQLVVTPTLQSTLHPSIFAMGDCASFSQQKDGKSIVAPPTAQVAHQQGTFLAKALPLHIKGEQLPTFNYRDNGALVSVSKHHAVGKVLGQFFVHGIQAQLMYYSMYRFHQVELHGLFKTSVWIWRDILSKFNGQPQIKVH